MPWDTFESIAHSLDPQQHFTSAPEWGLAAGSGDGEMSLHLGFGHRHGRSAEQQQELREAKRLLKEQVKDNWDYPPLPQWQSTGRKRIIKEDEDAKVAGFRFHTPSNRDQHFQVTSHGKHADRRRLHFEPLEWRERSYSSCDSSDSANESEATSRSSKSASGRKFRFEGPDSVGTELERRKADKKRQRQRDLEEEMEWNDGVRHWMARRDAWCGARTQSQIDSLRGVSHNAAMQQAREPSSASASAGSTPRSSTSTTDGEGSSSPPSESSDGVFSSPKPMALRPAPASPFDLLIPVCPSILPNHPVRARISTHTYHEIYTKIILQSRTPSVPINLLPLVRAMVQGWIDDGEWPPKPGLMEKSIASRRKSSGSKVKDGVKHAVGKVLRITHAESHHGEKEKG